MREIKFRGWDEGNKIMHFDFQFIRSGVEGNDWIIFISDKFTLEKHETNPFRNPSPYFSQQLKIMQYTGLKDSKGIEIYEGDIVKTQKTFGDKPTFETIEIKIDMLYGITIGTLYPERLSEVIGNIYENPELKKG